jgi:cellulose synthase/poly-beta-1,6-N-acetylglucosamine synthase-like glycosyltransferase
MACLLDDPEAMMALGPVFFNHRGSFLQKLQELEFFGIMGITAGSAALGIPVMANGANLCFRRDVFTMVGGYQRDSHFASGDDQFLMMSVKKQYGPGSVKFNFNLDAAIFTTAEKDLKGFFHQRIRWVSKSRGYRDGWVVLTGLVAGLTTLSLFAGVAWSVVNFSGALFIMVSGFWLVKIFSDLPMVLKMRKFSGSKVGLGYYIPAQLFQLVYAPLAGVASLFFRSRWKGRRV